MAFQLIKKSSLDGPPSPQLLRRHSNLGLPHQHAAGVVLLKCRYPLDPQTHLIGNTFPK